MLDPPLGVHTGPQSASDLSLRPQRRDMLNFGELQAESEPIELHTSSSLSKEADQMFPFPNLCSVISQSNQSPSLHGPPIQSSCDHVIDKIGCRCSSSTQRDVLSTGPTPQELVDTVCDMISSSPRTLSQSLAFLSEIWGRHGVLPKKWLFDNVGEIERHPFAVTASSDVKKASRNGNLLALKFLRPHYRSTGPEEPVIEFLQEACLWSSLDHRHILPFLGIFVKQQRLALVSRYQTNGSLYQFLIDQPAADRIRLLWGVASALKYLHSLPVPVLHGDIRAMNIVVDNAGEAMLIDFGCSSFVNERGHAMNSPSDPLRGTPRHMSPERMLPGPYPITLRADTWSFAMLCVEVFTNERPFSHIVNDGAVAVEVLVRHTRPPRPQGRFAAQLTNDIWGLLERCWDLDPSRRPSIDTIEALFALSAPIAPL